jgi:hypothetical protein
MTEVGSGSLEELRAAVRLLSDERAIREVLARYVHGCDRLDEEEVRSTYDPDAHDDHGPLRGPVSEFIPALFRSLRGGYTFCSMTLGQSRIDWIDTDHTSVETYSISATGRTVDGEEELDVVGGRYVDHLARTEGRWLITDRLFVPDYDARIPRTRWQDPDAWTTGRRDRQDASYAQ